MSKTKPALGDVIRVAWHDAWFDYEHSKTVFRESYLVITVGFLVRDDTEVISVAQERLPEGEGLRAVTHIPRSIITKVEVLSDGD